MVLLLCRVRRLLTGQAQLGPLQLNLERALSLMPNSLRPGLCWSSVTAAAFRYTAAQITTLSSLHELEHRLADTCNEAAVLIEVVLRSKLGSMDLLNLLWPVAAFSSLQYC